LDYLIPKKKKEHSEAKAIETVPVKEKIETQPLTGASAAEIDWAATFVTETELNDNPFCEGVSSFSIVTEFSINLSSNTTLADVLAWWPLFFHSGRIVVHFYILYRQEVIVLPAYVQHPIACFTQFWNDRKHSNL
jgi:hypothetical protein